MRAPIRIFGAGTGAAAHADGNGRQPLPRARGCVPMLALRVLGGFQVVQDGRELSELTAQPGRAALLVLLALEGSTTRDSVVALLWPEHDAPKARHALSQTLHRLRGALGDDWLESEGERLGIAPAVEVDARAFETLVEKGEHQQALPLYHGPFLPGWFLADSPGFELWTDRQRARLERLHRHARREWIRTCRERGDLAGALRCAQEWAELDPLEDEAQHRLIELLAESGHRGEALRQYELYRRLLDKEELRPLEETEQLVARLRQAGEASAFGAAVPNGATPAGPPATAPAAVSSPASRLARALARLRARPRGRALRLALAGGALALAAGTVGLGWHLVAGVRAQRAALPAGARVVLADFDNDTRDTLVSAVVTEALRIDLQRHLRSGLAGPTEVTRELTRMRRGPGPALSAEVAREVAIRAGIPAVIGGRVGAVGPGFVLSGWIVAASSGRIVEAAMATARDSTELIRAIQELSRQLSTVIRPSLAKLPAAVPLDRVTTTSLDALRQYSVATRARLHEGDNARAARLLRAAVALDTTFAMAYRALGIVLLNSDAPRREFADAFSAAYRYRDRLNEEERYLTVASYHQMVTGENELAIEAYENLLELDSANVVALNNLAVIHGAYRRYPQAETLLRRCVTADARGFICRVNLVEMVHAQGRAAEARALAEQTIRRFPDNQEARALFVKLATAVQDYAAADSLVAALVRADPGSRGRHQFDFALLDQARGRLTEAREHLRAAYSAAAGADPAQASLALRLEAWLELTVARDTSRALAVMEAALRDSSTLALDSVEAPYIELADFFLSAGRPERAGAALRTYLARVPAEVRRGQDGMLYSARGEMAMKRGRFEEAAEAFRVAETHVGNPMMALQYLGPLHESAGRPDSAIAAYERYLAAGSFRRLLWDAMLLPDVLEHLASLHERQGHPLEAARYYARLAELWAGADTELQPRVSAARRRAQLLRGAAPD